MLSSVCRSASLSVTPVYHIKAVEVRILKFSPYGSPIRLVLRGKFHPEIVTGSPSVGVNKSRLERNKQEGVRKQAIC